MQDTQGHTEVSLEKIKTEISGEVLAELEKAGATVVKTNYDGFEELANILNRFDKYMNRYNSEVDRITKRYSDKIRLEKIHELDVDLQGEKSWIGIELNSIVEKEAKSTKEAIAENRRKPEYKEARRDAIDILSKLGPNLDAETTMELLKPIIEAKDRLMLKALKQTSSKESRHLYVSAINSIEEYLSTHHLELCVRDARSYINNNTLFHGTLLFDANMDILSNALACDPAKMVSKGIKSVRSRVGNLKELYFPTLTTKEFLPIFAQKIKEQFSDVQEEEIPKELIEKAELLAQERYRSWEWTYGSNWKYDVENSKRFPAGRVNVFFSVENNKISSVVFKGDFFGSCDIEILQEKLIGTPLKSEAIIEKLIEVNLNLYIENITPEELAQLFG